MTSVGHLGVRATLVGEALSRLRLWPNGQQSAVRFPLTLCDGECYTAATSGHGSWR